MIKLEQNIANFKETCRRHCDIIETCLLDYEQYGISELLISIANSINQIRLVSKNLNIQNAVHLTDAMQRIITLSLDERIELLPADIDILLRANDLFFAMLQFSADEIIDMFENEIAIINEIINQINSIAAPYRLKQPSKQKTKVIKTSSEAESKGILLEKFKFALVRSANTIEQTLVQSESTTEEIDILPISQALNTIKGAAISAGVSKAFDLADAMVDFVRHLAENNIPINSYQMDILLKCTNMFKEIAASSAIAIIDKIKDYSDYIDSYSDFLRSFLNEQDQTTFTLSGKIASNEIIFLNENSNSSIDINNTDNKLYYFGYKSIKNDDFSKYNRLIDATISIISNLVPIQNSIKNIKDLKAEIRRIQLENNNILYNITNTEKITEIALNNSKKFDEIINLIDNSIITADDALLNIKTRINTVYNGLYSLRSYAFGDIVRGYNELVNDLASYSKKKVKLKLTGRFVRVGAELITLLELILPQLLKFVIMNNIEIPAERLAYGKEEVAAISLKAQTSSGRLVIEILDDGAGEDANIMAMKIENIINLINNNNGKIEIKSEQNKGTKIKITFNLNYVLLKVLIFEVAGNFYAVQIIDCDALIDENLFRNNFSYTHLIDMRKALEIETEYVSDKKPILIVKNQEIPYAIAFDKFIAEAEVSPIQPTKFFSKVPFVESTAIYNNTPVIIIDVQKLINIFVY